MGNPVIIMTPELLEKLKEARNKAIEEGKESFIFEGQELLVSYAKYVIEYAEGQFNSKGAQK